MVSALCRPLPCEQAQPGAVALLGGGRVDGDLLGGGVDGVGALAVQERLREVAPGWSPSSRRRRSSSLTVAASAFSSSQVLGASVMPAFCEQRLVVDQGQGVGDQRHAVGLALVLGLGDQVGLELVLVGQGLGAVQRQEVALLGEGGRPADLGAQHVGSALGAGGGVELVLRLVELDVDVLDLDALVGGLEVLDQGLVRRRLVRGVGRVPPRDGDRTGLKPPLLPLPLLPHALAEIAIAVASTAAPMPRRIVHSFEGGPEWEGQAPGRAFPSRPHIAAVELRQERNSACASWKYLAANF